MCVSVAYVSLQLFRPITAFTNYKALLLSIKGTGSSEIDLLNTAQATWVFSPAKFSLVSRGHSVHEVVLPTWRLRCKIWQLSKPPW